MAKRRLTGATRGIAYGEAGASEIAFTGSGARFLDNDESAVSTVAGDFGQCQTDGGGLGSLDASLPHFGGERRELPAAGGEEANQNIGKKMCKKSEAPARYKSNKKCDRLTTLALHFSRATRCTFQRLPAKCSCFTKKKSRKTAFF